MRRVPVSNADGAWQATSMGPMSTAPTHLSHWTLHNKVYTALKSQTVSRGLLRNSSRNHRSQPRKALVQTFSTNYVPSPADGTLRKIGLELEFPIVKSTGEAIEYDAVRSLFSWLEGQGWTVFKDEGTGERVAAEKPLEGSAGRFGYAADVIGTDVGYCTIEISLAPEDNLPALEEHWQVLKSTVLPYFSAAGCHVLGYGVQPISHPSGSLVANKGRYRFFEEDSLNRFIDQAYGLDLHVFATSAANQCHIDVYREEAITAVNVFNSLSPLLSAVTANAPVWKGVVDPEWLDVREIFWDKSWSNRIEQTGIPNEFSDFTDYVQRLCQFRPLMVKRGGQYIKVLGCEDFGEYLTRGSADGQTVDGRHVHLKSSLQDIIFHAGFAWWDARLAPAHGTLEVRPCSQQPGDATLAVAALSLGLVENLPEAGRICRQYTTSEWRKLRFDALRRGLNAAIGGRSIVPLVEDMLQVARAGLKTRKLGEETYLDVLERRVEAATTVADEVRRVFNKDDLQAFFDLVEIRHPD